MNGTNINEILLRHEKYRLYSYQMIVAGYDLKSGKEIIAVIEKEYENEIA